ncbi:MAG: septal ring lytic transglycosylase RlpA family protein [Proteobacteria bacterium]|nr:septal ring lytic transglycosylase RlpA family protein [Pseudomonadota bacterium]MDA0993597.1 septal ring lytic transglycosylase RlpA family protein [Pseudomonadota bacterium]
MLNHERLPLIAFLIATSLIAACASRPPSDGPPRAASSIPSQLPGDAIPREEPRSRYGNGPYYKVLGQTYKVLNSSSGYQERGVASWYGKKFHGRMTSNQEPYDMYAMTAAHKTLPLPTYVRVRNLRNNRTVIVRVNDRGPFVDNRLIDLSYAAATKLDLVKAGTGLVEVTAINFGESGSPPVITASAVRPNTEQGEKIFVQVGAFGEIENARRRFTALRDGGVKSAFVHKDSSVSPTLYRVRIGPIGDVTEYDSIIEELHRLGIKETHLVAE